MLLPYTSDRPPRHRPVTVVLLVLAHFLAFGALALVATSRPEAAVRLTTTLGLVPAYLTWYAPLTYSLLHENAFHLSVNMLFVWVFGGSVEDALGWRRLAVFYVVGVALSGLMQAAMARLLPGGDPLTPIVGASGGASVLVGLFAVRFYRSRVGFVGLPLRVHAVALLALVLVGEMAAVTWQLLDRNAAPPAVAHWAHIAGFLLGIGLGQAGRLMKAGRHEYLAVDARQAMDEGAPLTAARRWHELLAVEPENLHARAEAARAWGLTGDREQCQEHYLQAIEGYLKRGRRGEAAARYVEMREFCGDVVLGPPAQLSVAAALERQRDYEAAEGAYAALLEAHRDAPEAEMARVRRLVLLAERLGRREEAADALEDFVKRHPASDHRAYVERVVTGK